MREVRISSQKIYQGKILDLYRDQVQTAQGKTAFREVIRHKAAITVLPVAGDQLTLIKQFRYSTGEIMYEAVAGVIEDGEEPLEAAKRELAEEAGLQAKNWELIFSGYSAPGFCDELLYFYLASDLSQYQLPPDDDEQIEVINLSLAQAQQMVKQAVIKDVKTGLFIFYLGQMLNGKTN